MADTGCQHPRTRTQESVAIVGSTQRDRERVTTMLTICTVCDRTIGSREISRVPEGN